MPRCFLVTCEVEPLALRATAAGSSRRRAEQAAAACLLEQIPARLMTDFRSGLVALAGRPRRRQVDAAQTPWSGHKLSIVTPGARRPRATA